MGEGAGQEEEFGKKRPGALSSHTAQRYPQEDSSHRLCFVPHNSLEANGRWAPNCKYLSKYPRSPVSGSDTAHTLGMLSWAPVPGTLIYPGPKKTQMCAPLTGPREGDRRAKNAALPQAQECLIAAPPGCSERKGRERETSQGSHLPPWKPKPDRESNTSV